MKPVYHDLRKHRKRSPFTQQDIAELLGNKDISQISRHETNPAHPQVELGLLYEILFGIPVSELFSNQKQSIINRLQKRIPNIIHELECLDLNDIINSKIGCLQNVLLTINKKDKL